MDIKTIVAHLIEDFNQSILSAVTQDLPAVKDAAKAWALEGKDRLTHLAENTLNGELQFDFVVRRLKEEEVTLKDALIGVEQMLAADIEALATKIISGFEGLLRKTILEIEPS